jgi:hypothetical protein
MKTIRAVFAASSIIILLNAITFAAAPTTGFFLPDSVNEMTLTYRAVRGLIVLPVTLNDSVHVNLILDTGCRNLILFGKKFTKLFKMNSGKPVIFSGLGSGKSVTGTLSLGNSVSIGEVVGQKIPVVVVPNSNLFKSYHNVHGVIGYDIFLKFEVEVNAKARTITFRPALKSSIPPGYTQVPLHVVDARPLVKSELFVENNTSRALDLMIDTGSSLGLLLKTTNISEFDHHGEERILGIGFNGPVSGYGVVSRRLRLKGLDIERVSTGIVSSEWHNNASIGMEILKDYIVILNYCKAYACFRKNDV